MNKDFLNTGFVGAIPSGDDGGSASCVTVLAYDNVADSDYNQTDGVDKIALNQASAEVIEDNSNSPTEYVWRVYFNYVALEHQSGGGFTTTVNKALSGTAVYVELGNAGSNTAIATVNCHWDGVTDVPTANEPSSVFHTQLSSTTNEANNTTNPVEIYRHTGQISGNVIKFPYRLKTVCGGVTRYSSWGYTVFDVAGLASSASLSVYDGSCDIHWKVTNCDGSGTAYTADSNYYVYGVGDVIQYTSGSTTKCATVVSKSLFETSNDSYGSGFSDCSDCAQYLP